jgi:hypothetical protein
VEGPGVFRAGYTNPENARRCPSLQLRTSPLKPKSGLSGPPAYVGIFICLTPLIDSHGDNNCK